MGFGSTAKKIQKLADTAEKLYHKLNELREQVVEMRDTLDSTNDRVETLERESAEQRALLEALAEERGVDVEEAVAAADVPAADDGEGAEEAASDGAGDGTESNDAEAATDATDAGA